MIGEVICVGNELLIGDTLNTNTQFLSQQLTELGIEVLYQSVVGDYEEQLLEAIDYAKKRSDVIIFSGGLGPTYDDMTKETVAKSLGMPMVMDERSVEAIEDFFRDLGREMAQSNLKQALRPEGGIALHNGNGTAPGGVYVEQDKTHYFLLPGPPRELKPMFESCVKPILSKLSTEVITSRIFKLFGIGESDLAVKIGHIMDVSDNPRVAPYAKLGSVNIRVTATTDTVEEGSQMIEDMTKELMPFIGQYCYTYEDKELEEIIVEKLIEKRKTIALAESCTGGLLSARLVGVPGVSQVYKNGIVTYANESKIKWLGVDEQVLMDNGGAVSQEVATAMAVGVKNVSDTNIGGVGITGVAGPGGGTKEKPVGTVHIAVAYDDDVYHTRLNINGLRQKIRDYSVQRALMLLFEILK